MIEKIKQGSRWYNWLFASNKNGLDESTLSDAVRELTEKLNEVIEELNALKK